MKRVRFFILSAGVILLAAALIRFVIAVGNAQVLLLPEPLLGIPLRFAVLLIGGFELAVALVCLFGRQVNVQLGLLAWLATNFVVFFAGLFTMHVHPQATCIGSLTDPLDLSRGTAGFILGFTPFYLLLGSGAAMAWLWFSKENRTARQRAAQQRAKQHDAAAGLLKMPCPACGVHIKFARQNLGQIISCPKCQKAITLRKPDLLKMSCFFCKEHIEFPNHAIGEKISCPHCKMDITLKEPA